MSAYTHVGYTYAGPTSQLVVGQGGGSTGTNTTPNTCCDGARALMTDPVTGQTVCSCQYDRLALGSYSRLGSSLSSTTGSVYGSTYPPSEQGPYPSIGMDSSAFYSPLGTGYSMKEGSTSDVGMYGTGLGASPAGYYPYDATFAAYGYAPGYDLAARRKNATRESTATLKAWLNEHKKNPYPTKGEKIMLAIITKMTLTQVSTWFANARRRLKKENKMTWEPRNKTDDDDAKLSDDEEDEKEPGDKDDDDMKKDEKDTDTAMNETKLEDNDCQTELKSCDGGAVSKTVTAALSPAPILHHGSPYSVPKGDKSACALSMPCSKPKIWSLADTAASKTPPPVGSVAWLNGATTFPLPPTIPQQPQYSRFSQLMSGVNGAQYMGAYNESVGTDTPPQTPPNANKSSSANGVSQSAMASNFINGSSTNFSSNLSSCSRGSTLPIPSTLNANMDMHARYNNMTPANTSASSMNASSQYSNIYKSQSQNTAQSVMTSQQQAFQSPQEIPCQPNHHPIPVTGSYVS